MKRLLTLFTFLLISQMLTAQTHRFELGFRAGVGINTLSLQTHSEVSIGNSMAILAACQFNFSEVFSLSLYPGYERRTYSEETLIFDDFGNLTGTQSFKSSNSYFAAPVLAKFSFGGATQFFFQGGI